MQQQQYVYLLCNGSTAGWDWLNGLTQVNAVALAPEPNSLAYQGFSGTQWNMVPALTPKGETAYMFETQGTIPGNRILYGDVDEGKVQLANNSGENETMWIIQQQGFDPLGNVPTYTLKCADQSFGGQYLNGGTADGSVSLYRSDDGANLPTGAFWFIFAPPVMS